MDKARIFETGEIVSAQDVFDGKHSRYENYVDEEEDFRAVYVKAAKNHGKPYFKLYLSREDYNKLSQEQKTKYDILCEQRHYQESAWHRGWENKLKHCAEIEKTIPNPNTKKRKRADAFLKEKNICVEFQHSFIDFDFEERNAFYSEIGIKTIWLYDLTSLHVKPMEDGSYSILENNAKGFFRVAEESDNLKNNLVFIQARDKMIYQIDELDRKQIDNKLKSTVRFFNPIEILSEEEFVERVKNDSLRLRKEKNEESNNEFNSVYELWQPDFYQMVVKDTENGNVILIHKDNQSIGKMQFDYKYPSCIIYRYAEWISNHYIIKNKKYYHLSDYKAKQKKWILIADYRETSSTLK